MKKLLNKRALLMLIMCTLIGIWFLWPIISNDYREIHYETSVHNVDKQRNSAEYSGHIIYITGAVEAPGLYKLSEPGTVQDLVATAGGLLPYADTSAVNLAAKTESGTHIHIPFTFMGNPEILLRKPKLNINTATIEELKALPRIGDAIAKRIVDYRQEKGNFKQLEDLKEVKGIGEGLYNNIKKVITI